MKRDLTRGSVLKNILLISIPTIFGYTSQMVYDLVDIFWIGKISGEAVAGITIFSVVFWLIGTLNEVIGQSSVSLISQNYGKKDIKATEISIEQTIAFKFLMALIAAVFMALFLKPLIGIFSVEQKVVSSAFDYGYIRLFFLPIMFSSYSVNTALRCIGDAKTPMYIMLFSSILNIVLDPLLMFSTIPGTSIPGFGMGVFGAALATVISQTISFLIGFLYLFSGKAGLKPKLSGLFKLHPSIDRKLLTIGLPNGFESLFRNLSNAIIMKFVAVYGTTVIAATGVAGRLLGLAFMPLLGLMMGGSTIVGQNLGAENVKRAQDTAVVSGFVGVISTAVFTVIVWIWGREIMGLFSSDPEIILHGADFLKISSVGLTVLAWGFGLGTAFSGSGYNFPFVVGGVASRWVIQIPILVLSVTLLKLPVLWVWLSYTFADVAEAFIYFAFYRKGKWKKMRT